MTVVSFIARDMIMLLYGSLIRPNIEYVVHFSFPYLTKCIEMLEKFQHNGNKDYSGFGRFGLWC